MEYCHCGSVGAYLRSGNRLKEEELREVVSCCLLGLSYLHNRNVMHRDIKPDNLFISESGVIKLGDFGLAVQLEHSCSKRNTTCGTSMYMGPEVYGEGAELKSDVWALGMSVIEMAESKNPFARCTSAQVMNRVMNMPPPSLSSSGWSSDLVDFVKKCLVKDVKKRASVDELLKHPFVKDSIERIRNKGNSSLLLQLADRVGNVTPPPNDEITESMNVVDVTMLNKPMTQEDKVRAEHMLSIDDDNDLFVVKSDTDAIYMKSGLCNDPEIVEWKLEVYPGLRELVVGNDCLQFVKGLELRRFKYLEKVEIGARCFCESEGYFEVSECAKLRSVKLGDGCCVKWSSFVMRNCGVIEVSIGDGCFVSCENTVFESLSALTKLIVGNEAFRGNEKKKSALVMKSECCERE